MHYDVQAVCVCEYKAALSSSFCPDLQSVTVTSHMMFGMQVIHQTLLVISNVRKSVTDSMSKNIEDLVLKYQRIKYTLHI